MGRFFNKYELVIIVIIFVLFDLNGSCREFLNHIIFKNKKNTMAFFIVLVTLLYDAYLVHLVVNSTRTPDIKYATNNVRNIMTCADEADIQIARQSDILTKLETICEPDPDQPALITSKKIVMSFMAGVLILVVIICVNISESDYEVGEINKFNTRLSRSVYLILTAGLLLYAAHG